MVQSMNSRAGLSAHAHMFKYKGTYQTRRLGFGGANFAEKLLKHPEKLEVQNAQAQQHTTVQEIE